jgi:hypothetical protein
MFHPNLPVRKPCVRRRKTLYRTIAVIISGTLSIVTLLERPAAGFAVDPSQSKAKPTELPKDPGGQKVDPDRKLLADLDTAIDAYADHADYAPGIARRFDSLRKTSTPALALAVLCNRKESLTKPRSRFERRSGYSLRTRARGYNSVKSYTRPASSTSLSPRSARQPGSHPRAPTVTPFSEPHWESSIKSTRQSPHYLRRPTSTLALHCKRSGSLTRRRKPTNKRNGLTQASPKSIEQMRNEVNLETVCHHSHSVRSHLEGVGPISSNRPSSPRVAISRNAAAQPARGLLAGRITRESPSAQISTSSGKPACSRSTLGMRIPREFPIRATRVFLARDLLIVTM